jgi:Txe/YoeB family toxin of Txe-Axe toxin-antitoxin module
MTVLPLREDLESYVKRHQLTAKFRKQKSLFESNPFHPGLHTELLEPRQMRIWSFRINQRYRAIFIFREKYAIEILDINDHYR